MLNIEPDLPQCLPRIPEVITVGQDTLGARSYLSDWGSRITKAEVFALSAESDGDGWFGLAIEERLKSSPGRASKRPSRLALRSALPECLSLGTEGMADADP